VATVRQVVGDLIFLAAFASIWIYACLETQAPIEAWVIGLGILAFVFAARAIEFMQGKL
jgi:putative effector of murein hydrolase LrgA (UPF0299 family)